MRPRYARKKSRASVPAPRAASPVSRSIPSPAQTARTSREENYTVRCISKLTRYKVFFKTRKMGKPKCTGNNSRFRNSPSQLCFVFLLPQLNRGANSECGTNSTLHLLRCNPRPPRHTHRDYKHWRPRTQSAVFAAASACAPITTARGSRQRIESACYSYDPFARSPSPFSISARVGRARDPGETRDGPTPCAVSQ